MDELDFTEDRNALYRLATERGLSHDEAIALAAYCVTPITEQPKEQTE